MTHVKSLLACLVVATAVVGATAEPARACSCAPPDPRTLLAQTDGAFVGRLESRRDLDAGRAVFTFRVERSVKGRLGNTVEVEGASNGAACGLEAQVGARIGLFLTRDGARWTSSLCWQVSPEDLLAAAEPLPPPDGRGPVTVLVGGRFGAVRTLALDALGRTLAYGRGPGSVLHLSPCPGGRRVVEVVQLDTGVVLAVRTLPALRLVRQRSVASPPGTSVTAARCESVDGAQALLFHSSAARPADARLVRLTRGRSATLWRGAAVAAALTRREAFLATGARGTRLIAVGLGRRTVRTLGRIPPPASGLVATADGTIVAGQTYSDASRPLLFRVRTPRYALATVQAAGAGELAFDARNRVVFLPSGGTRARVYGPALAVAAGFRWTAYRSTIAGATAYGIGFGGRVHRAPVPSGPERVTRRLPGPNASVIVPAR